MQFRLAPLVLTAVTLAVTACGSSPTAAAAPSDARMDGGTFGSGHIVAPDDGGFGSGHDMESTDESTVIPADTTGRGGTFGSGH